MDLDILTPEFMDLAAKAKELYEKRDKAVQDFKALWLKHKEELAVLDAEAVAIKEEYAKAVASGKKAKNKSPEES